MLPYDLVLAILNEISKYLLCFLFIVIFVSMTHSIC